MIEFQMIYLDDSISRSRKNQNRREQIVGQAIIYPKKKKKKKTPTHDEKFGKHIFMINAVIL